MGIKEEFYGAITEGKEVWAWDNDPKEAVQGLPISWHAESSNPYELRFNKNGPFLCDRAFKNFSLTDPREGYKTLEKVQKELAERWEFINFRDAVKNLIDRNGAFVVQALFNTTNCPSNTETVFEWLDELVKKGEIVKLRGEGAKYGSWGQYEVYADPKTHNL